MATYKLQGSSTLRGGVRAAAAMLLLAVFLSSSLPASQGQGVIPIPNPPVSVAVKCPWNKVNCTAIPPPTTCQAGGGYGSTGLPNTKWNFGIRTTEFIHCCGQRIYIRNLCKSSCLTVAVSYSPAFIDTNWQTFVNTPFIRIGTNVTAHVATVNDHCTNRDRIYVDARIMNVTAGSTIASVAGSFTQVINGMPVPAQPVEPNTWLGSFPVRMVCVRLLNDPRDQVIDIGLYGAGGLAC